jgi:hypothetical protein
MVTTRLKRRIRQGVQGIEPARAVAEGLVTLEGDPDAVLRFGALTENAFAEVL